MTVSTQINKKNIPSGYKQTEIGVIPVDWEVVRIDEKAEIQTGSKNTQDRIEDGKYPFFVRSQTVERINSYSFDGEAVLTAGDGVGTGKVFHYINGKFDVHQRVYRMSKFSNGLNGKYFFYQFSTRFFDRIMSMTAKSSVDSVRREMIAGMKIPFPTDPKEQTVIATALSDTDALIEKLEKLIDKKKAIKQGAMQLLLTGKKRLPGFENRKGYKQTEIGMVPEDWDVDRLGDFVTIRSGESPSKFNISKSGVPYYKVDQLNNSIKFQKETPYYIEVTNPIKANSLIFPKRGAAIYQDKIRILAQDSYMDTNLMTLTVDSKLDTEYLFYYLHKRGLSYIADTTSVPQINNKHIIPFKIIFPKSKPEQTAIATVLSDMDVEIEKLESKLTKYCQIKIGMMQQLLTGKIRLVKK